MVCDSSFCWAWSSVCSCREYVRACWSWFARITFVVISGIWWAPPNFTIAFEAPSSTVCFLVAVYLSFCHAFMGIRSCGCLIILDAPLLLQPFVFVLVIFCLVYTAATPLPAFLGQHMDGIRCNYVFQWLFTMKDFEQDIIGPVLYKSLPHIARDRSGFSIG